MRHDMIEGILPLLELVPAVDQHVLGDAERAEGRSGEIWSRTWRVTVCVHDYRRTLPFRPEAWPVSPRYVNARLDFSTPLRSARNDKRIGTALEFG
jgi:hypothetical protein